VIHERRNAGATILLSTHQMNKVEELCDRALMIHHGRRVLYGPIRQLMREHSDDSVLVRTTADLTQAPFVTGIEPENGAVRVRFAAGAGPSELLAWLAAQRAEVEEFRHLTTPLEDVFVRVVAAAGGAARSSDEDASLAARTVERR
jgi:ABC-2 type transport system ATP-binding protein